MNMKKSKLYAIYRILSIQEKRDLDKIVASPYLNRREDVRDLYNFLRKTDQQMAINLDKKEVFKSIYPDATFDETRMRYCMSFLLKLIEDYLAQKAATHHKVQRQIHLAKAYRERNLEKHFSQALNTAKLELGKLPKDQAYHHFNYQLEMEQYAYNSNRKRSTENNLQDLSYHYDVQYLANKLKQSCLLLSHQAVYKVEYDEGLLSLVLDFLEDSTYLDIPAIGIYYYCYKALTAESEYHFQQLKAQILDHKNIFPPDELTDVLLLAINFCIRQLNTGSTQYIEEAFTLYNFGITNKLFLAPKQLNPFRFIFKNTVALGLRLGKLEYIENFISEYHTYIPSRYRQSYHHYNLARLHYYKKDYQQAMPLLVTVDSRDLLLNIDAKILLLKMYYELKEFDALDALLASFKTFLNRKKVMSYHRDNYLKIIDFTRKLLYLKEYDMASKNELKQKIEASTVSEKEWLLNQM